MIQYVPVKGYYDPILSLVTSVLVMPNQEKRHNTGQQTSRVMEKSRLSYITQFTLSPAQIFLGLDFQYHDQNAIATNTLR